MELASLFDIGMAGRNLAEEGVKGVRLGIEVTQAKETWILGHDILHRIPVGYYVLAHAPLLAAYRQQE
jgi:hypothetical protein